jgi:hypothetical protein
MKCANRSWQELQLHNRNLRIGLKRPSQAKSSENKQKILESEQEQQAYTVGGNQIHAQGKEKEAPIPRAV